MTLAQLETEMSVEEFDTWMAEDEIRSFECPFCGVEPSEMMEFDYKKVHCPNCSSDYHKTVRRAEPSASSAQQVPSAGLQAVTP